jgi:hypothetical protein
MPALLPLIDNQPLDGAANRVLPPLLSGTLPVRHKRRIPVQPYMGVPPTSLRRRPELRSLAIQRHFLRRPGFVLAIISFWLGVLWVAAIKPLDAPDEPAHLQTIMEVRRAHILPEVHYDLSQPGGIVIGTPGDAAARDYAVAHGINDGFRLTPYESIQPPLYYVICGLLAGLVEPNPQTVLYLSRLVSALFGAGVVYFVWAAARDFAPGCPMWAVGAAGVVALLPQFCFNSATAANDSIANCACAAAFAVWFRALRRPDYDTWMLRCGAIMGIALLSKLTATALLPGLGLVVFFRAFQLGKSQQGFARRVRHWVLRFLRMLTGATIAILAVCGWWLVRNLIVYGDISGSRDGLEFFKGKFVLLDVNSAGSWNWFLEWSWHSTWGRFGWMGATLPGEFYEQARNVALDLLILSGLALLGVLGRWAIVRRGIPVHSLQAALVMGVAAGLLAVGYIQFSTTVAFQPQARYFFPVLLPAGLAFTGGLHALAPGRVLKVLALAAPLLWLSLLNVSGLGIVPQ